MQCLRINQPAGDLTQQKNTSLVYEKSWILTLTPRRKKKLGRKEKKESKTDDKNTKLTKLY